MADYALKKAEYETITQQIKADYNSRLKALRTADTTFDRGFTALVALSRAGTKATCQFNNAWLFLIE
jgi:lysozyme family protein